jgi:tetratricopeptide (TPR) repeat protein
VKAKRLAEAEDTYQRVAALPDREYKPFHAMFEYSIGQRETALKEFERLSKTDPNDRQARTRLLSLYLETGKIVEAQDLLDTALKKNAKDTDALLQRSALELKWGKPADAERDLNQVLHYQPNSTQAHLALAGVYRAQGLKRNERQELNEALRLDPKSLPARLTLARNFLASNEAKAALDLLNQTPTPQKNIVAVVEQRNWALLSMNSTAEAETELKRDLQAGRRPEFVLQDAVVRMRQNHFDEARELAEEVLKSQTADLRAVDVILDSYVAQKQQEKATKRLKEIADAQPKAAPLQYLLAQWQERLGNFKEARKAAEQAKTADSKFVDPEILLAQIDRKESHFDAAKQRLDRVIGANPQNIPAHLLLASLNDGLGDREGAIQNYRAVLVLDNSNLYALNNLAFNLAPQKPDEALKIAQQAAEMAPENPTVQDTLGWVYFHKGLYDSALRYLKTAYGKQPTPKRQYHLAMCYLKVGNQDEGRKNLLAALQKDPSLTREQ